MSPFDPISTSLGLGEVALGLVQVMQGFGDGAKGTLGKINWQTTQASYPAGLEHVPGDIDTDVNRAATITVYVDQRLANELENVDTTAMRAKFALAGTFSGTGGDPVGGWATHEGDRRWVVANRYMANVHVRLLPDEELTDNCSIDFEAKFFDTAYEPKESPSILCGIKGRVTIWGSTFPYEAYLYIYADGRMISTNPQVGSPEPVRADQMPWKSGGLIDAVDMGQAAWAAAADAGKIVVRPELDLTTDGLKLKVNVGHEDSSFDPPG